MHARDEMEDHHDWNKRGYEKQCMLEDDSTQEAITATESVDILMPPSTEPSSLFENEEMVSEYLMNMFQEIVNHPLSKEDEEQAGFFISRITKGRQQHVADKHPSQTMHRKSNMY